MEQNFDRELGWDDEIKEDGGENVVLAPGDYVFEITKFERARYTPGPNSKLPACNMAKLTLKIDTPQGPAFVTDNLYLHTSTERLLSAFFAAIGQKKKDAPLQMNWNQVTGAKGAAKVKNRTYQNNTYNEVDRFYPMDASYYTTKEAPEVVKQVNPALGSGQPIAQQGYQQPQTPQQPTQPQGYTPGSF